MNKLKIIRKSLGVSQSALAEKMQCTSGTISHYETERRIPDVAVGRQLIAALNQFGANCTFDDVFPPRTE